MGLKVRHGDMLVDSELLELDRQAKYGDAVAGWRGDDQMFVCLSLDQQFVQVWGVDRYNREYVAAEVAACTPGWRHRLIAKLVKGDWQHRAGNLVEDTMAANAKIREDSEQRFSEYLREELAPKLHHALVKDGHAQRSTFPMTPRSKERNAG